MCGAVDAAIDAQALLLWATSGVLVGYQQVNGGGFGHLCTRARTGASASAAAVCGQAHSVGTSRARELEINVQRLEAERATALRGCRKEGRTIDCLQLARVSRGGRHGCDCHNPDHFSAPQSLPAWRPSRISRGSIRVRSTGRVTHTRIVAVRTCGFCGSKGKKT